MLTQNPLCQHVMTSAEWMVFALGSFSYASRAPPSGALSRYQVRNPAAPLGRYLKAGPFSILLSNDPVATSP